MKKILVLLVLLICFTFCGCAKITAERSFNKNSSVTDKIIFELSEAEIEGSGYTLENVKEYIKSVMESNGYDITLDEGVKIVGVKHYETREEFYNAIGSGSDSNEDVPQDSFFVYHESQSGTPFKEILISGDVEKVIEAEFPNADKSILEDVIYSYKYKTAYKSVQSNSTVDRYVENGLYVHEWTWNALQAVEGTMIIKQTVPNVAGWYGLAIALGITIVGLGYFLINKNKKEKRNGRKKAK